MKFIALPAVSAMSVWASIALCLALPGCGFFPRREAVPPGFAQKAAAMDSTLDPPNSPQLRYWPSIGLDPLIRDANLSNDRERAALAASGQPSDPLPPANFLAISGGGDAGAFGAGLMVGWTQRGNRPEFKVVTGVSAGALIAPFAFLGSRYDGVLHDVAVSIQPKDIYHARNYLSALLSDAFADDGPLAALIEKFVTQDVVADVAREYSKGRVLLVGTTDLDSCQPVVWNMGEIASSKDPRAAMLFRRILLASASIPGIFPPVMIDVTVDGAKHQEMHVDGAVIAQVFLFPPAFVQAITANRPVNTRDRSVYVVRNGRITATWRSVARRSTSVGRRALEGLIDAQGINDMYRLEVTARDEKEDFHVAYIGDEFSYPHRKLFDGDYLRHLFEYGYQMAAQGNPWHKSLPPAIRSGAEPEAPLAP
jgi:predicted acylesterase/phospholipase RssA